MALLKELELGFMEITPLLQLIAIALRA